MRRLLPILLLSLAAACGGGDSGSSGDGTPRPTVPGQKESFSDKVPAELKDMPLPDDAKVVYSATVPAASASGGSATAMFATKLSADELKAFFGKELAAKGWKIERCQPAPLGTPKADGGETPKPGTVILAYSKDALQQATLLIGNLDAIKDSPQYKGKIKQDPAFLVVLQRMTQPLPTATSSPATC